MFLKLNTILFCHLFHTLGRVHTNGQNDHVELFLDDSVLGGRVSNGDIVRHRVLFHDRRIAPEESDPRKILCPLVIALEILSVGAHVVVEDGAFRIRVVVLRQDDLFWVYIQHTAEQ